MKKTDGVWSFLITPPKEDKYEEIIVEEDLKKELLEIEDEELVSTLSEYSVDDVVEYGIFHNISQVEGKKVLNLVKLVVDEGYVPRQIKGLTVGSDWDEMIHNFLKSDKKEIVEEEIVEEDLGKSYEEYAEEERKEEARLRRLAGNRRGGRKSKRNAVCKISIRNVRSKEVIRFDSKGDCMKWLNICSFNTFTQFLKGKSKKNKLYEVFEVG